MTPFQRQVKIALGFQAGVRDITTGIARKDGTFVYRRSYFYRPAPLKEWGAQVQAKLAGAGIACTMELRDVYKKWPKNSFLEAVIREVTHVEA